MKILLHSPHLKSMWNTRGESFISTPRTDAAPCFLFFPVYFPDIIPGRVFWWSPKTVRLIRHSQTGSSLCVCVLKTRQEGGKLEWTKIFYLSISGPRGPWWYTPVITVAVLATWNSRDTAVMTYSRKNCNGIKEKRHTDVDALWQHMWHQHVMRWKWVCVGVCACEEGNRT